MDEGRDDRHAWEQRGTFPVGPGVHRIPLPLPGDGLKAVNVYAIEQPDGLVLIDAGWALGEAQEHLATGLEALDADLGSVRQVLVTHMHRDHYELGVHLQREFGARLALGEHERAPLEHLLSDVPDEESPMLARLQAAGAEPLVEMLSQWHRPEQLDWTLPDHWLTDGEVIELADRRLTAVRTPGHTQGHVVFVDHEAGLLFAGDHVLPHITPSVGFEQIPVASALGDYLASLALVRAMPDLELLPAHGPVRPTTHDRVDALLVHHEHRLRASHKAVADGHATTYEVAGALGWTRRDTPFAQLDPFNQMLAVNETFAHLEVLVRRDDLDVTDVDGVRHYTT